jgi:hypothetical protein
MPIGTRGLSVTRERDRNPVHARMTPLPAPLQGFEPHGNPYSHPPGVTPTVGADPLLGFHLPRVFPPPAMAEPFERPPLAHFPAGDAEAALATVPQSLNEQEDWLVSREIADPFEIPVLVFPALVCAGRTRTGRSPSEAKCRTRYR